MKFIISCILLFFCQTSAQTTPTNLSGNQTINFNIQSSLPIFVSFNNNSTSKVDGEANLSPAKSSRKCHSGIWVQGSGGEFPKGTLPIGIYRKNKTYVARVDVDGSTIPGKVYKGNAYAIVDNKYEQPFYDYQTLCGNENQFIWKPAREGNLPTSAFLAGQTIDGRPLYLCRVNIDGADIASGLVSDNICYVGIDFNNALKKTDFEVLAERSE